MFKYTITESDKHEYFKLDPTEYDLTYYGSPYRCTCYQQMPSTKMSVFTNQEEALNKFNKALQDFALQRRSGYIALQIDEIKNLYPQPPLKDKKRNTLILAEIWCQPSAIMNTDFHKKLEKQTLSFSYTLYTCPIKVSWKDWYLGDLSVKQYSSMEDAIIAYQCAEKDYHAQKIHLVSLRLNNHGLKPIYKNENMGMCLVYGPSVTVYGIRRISEHTQFGVTPGISREEWDDDNQWDQIWDDYIDNGYYLSPGSDHCIALSPDCTYVCPLTPSEILACD